MLYFVEIWIIYKHLKLYLNLEYAWQKNTFIIIIRNKTKSYSLVVAALHFFLFCLQHLNANLKQLLIITFTSMEIS